MSLKTTSTTGFSVGICASDDADSLPSLLSFLQSEDFGDAFCLSKVVIVASGCPPGALATVKQIADHDARIELISEAQRHGKASAINRIIGGSSGAFLVMVNADAFPEKGAIRRLLEVARDPSVGVVSATPFFEDGRGLLRDSLSVMWSAHSVISLKLNHAGISNHACDELTVVRKSLVPKLPANVVNDGAYIGGLVRSKGYLVKFSTTARVKIAVPRRLADVIRQRRRIIFGHIQIWRKLGRPPKTMESMMFMNPMVSLRTLVTVVSRRPKLLASLPVVFVGETSSIILGLVDALRSTDMHTVWRRNVD